MSENEVEGAAGAPPVAEDGATVEDAAAADAAVEDAAVADAAVGDAAVGDAAAADASAVGAGSAAVDSPVADALAGLDSLAERDLAEHPEVFERIHDDLHAALTSIDDA